MKTQTFPSASIFADDAADTLTSSQEEEHVLPLTETEA